MINYFLVYDASNSTPLEGAFMLRKLLADKELQKELKLENCEDELLAVYYTIPRRGFRSRTKLGVTKLFKDFNVATGSGAHLNFVTKDIIVSDIPYLENCDEIIKFTENKLGLIASPVDYFEIAGNLMLRRIATPFDWKERNIPQFCSPTKDFGAKVPIIAIIYLLDKMRECVLRGKIVLVHCKAGHGRSAMHAECYIAVYEPDCRPAEFNLETLDQDARKALQKADIKAKEGREEIGLDAEQTQKALDTIKICYRIQAAMAAPAAKKTKEHKDEAKSEDENMTLDKFLASTEAKLEIAQLTYFKELAIYAASLLGSAKRTATVQAFFTRIREAKDAGWYHDYHRILQPLLDAAPSFGTEDDKKRRETLVAGLFNELTEYLISKKLKMNIREETSSLKISA